MSSLVGVSGMLRNKEGNLVCSICGNTTIRLGAMVVGKVDNSWTVYAKCPCCESSVVLLYDKNKKLKENLRLNKNTSSGIENEFESEDKELLQNI